MIKDKILEALEEWSKFEFKNIKKENTYNKNLPFAFLGTGTLGEELTLLLFPNSIGSASKGGCAFDNKEINEKKEITQTREVKFCSLDGSKECVCCKKKAPRFQDICIYCDDPKFRLIKDSRWGISAKSHILYCDKHNLSEYILYLSEYNETTKSINVKCFMIESNNKYFTEYIKNQHENGKGDTCNFQPYSWDFYLSGPITLFDLELYENEPSRTIYFNLENRTPNKIPQDICSKRGCKKYAPEITDDLFKDNDGLNYHEYIDKFSLQKKSLGKERGITTRN